MLLVRNNVVTAVGKPGAARTNANRLGFTLLTYNVLAEIYATSDAYPYCSSWALPWNYRRRNILRELVNYRADIMCLQEVQADHFENFLEPELAKFNYAAVYKCKTREFMGQYGKMDGCAVFYRRDKFSIVPSGILEVEFNSIARARHGADKRLLNRLLKDNVAQVLLFEMHAPGPHPSTRRQLLIANTHINASPEFADVKLWQTQQLLLEIERMMTQHGGSISLRSAPFRWFKPAISILYRVLIHTLYWQMVVCSPRKIHTVCSARCPCGMRFRCVQRWPRLALT